MEDSSDNFPNGLHIGSIEIESAEGGCHVLVISAIANRVHFGHASLAQKVVEVRITLQLQFSRFIVWRSKQ